jgi:hypothetical protein
MSKNKIWCKHIKYWHRKAQKDVITFTGIEDFPEASGWSYTLSCLVFPDNDKWKFCPICGVKKPE